MAHAKYNLYTISHSDGLDMPDLMQDQIVKKMVTHSFFRHQNSPPLNFRDCVNTFTQGFHRKLGTGFKSQLSLAKLRPK